MTGYRIVVVRQAGSGHAAPAPHPQTQAIQGVPSGDDIAREIQRGFQEAARATAQTKGQTRVITADGRQIVVGPVGVPTAEVPHDRDFMIPPQMVDMTVAFCIMLAVIIIGLPLARAFGRRIERRGAPAALPDPAIAGQLQRIEQAVDAMSIEIERISESQRFLAKLQNGAAADRSSLHAGERR